MTQTTKRLQQAHPATATTYSGDRAHLHRLGEGGSRGVAVRHGSLHCLLQLGQPPLRGRQHRLALREGRQREAGRGFSWVSLAGLPLALHRLWRKFAANGSGVVAKKAQQPKRRSSQQQHKGTPLGAGARSQRSASTRAPAALPRLASCRTPTPLAKARQLHHIIGLLAHRRRGDYFCRLRALQGGRPRRECGVLRQRCLQLRQALGGAVRLEELLGQLGLQSTGEGGGGRGLRSKKCSTPCAWPAIMLLVARNHAGPLGPPYALAPPALLAAGPCLLNGDSGASEISGMTGPPAHLQLLGLGAVQPCLAAAPGRRHLQAGHLQAVAAREHAQFRVRAHASSSQQLISAAHAARGTTLHAGLCIPCLLCPAAPRAQRAFHPFHPKLFTWEATCPPSRPQQRAGP